MINDRTLHILGESKASLEMQLDTLQFSKLDGSYKYLTDLAIHTLTKE